jgi:hypothetical protein
VGNELASDRGNNQGEATMWLRTPLERAMDEIVSATSPRELEAVWVRIHAALAGEPEFAALEELLAAKRLAFAIRRARTGDVERGAGCGAGEFRP